MKVEEETEEKEIRIGSTTEVRSGGVRVTRMNLDLMVLLAEHGYLGIDEVAMFVKSRGYAYCAVAKLFRMGLVSRHTTGTVPSYVVFLTRAGYRMLQAAGRWSAGPRFVGSDFAPGTCAHRLACAAVRLSLERAGVVSAWSPECLIHAGGETSLRRCDAEFMVGSTRLGLEVELSPKSPYRLRRILIALGERSELDLILWVVKNARVRAALDAAYRLTRHHSIAHVDKHMVAWYGDVVPKGRLDTLKRLDGRDMLFRRPS